MLEPKGTEHLETYENPVWLDSYLITAIGKLSTAWSIYQTDSYC